MLSSFHKQINAIESISEADKSFDQEQISKADILQLIK